jgi:hypothetical protein
MTLWDFSRAVRDEVVTKRLAVGHVSLAVQKVSCIKLWRRRRAKGESICETCGNSEWVILAHASVHVDDGTTCGEVIVKGFRVLLEVLQTSKEESFQIRDAVIRHDLLRHQEVAPGGEIGVSKIDCSSTVGSAHHACSLLGVLARRACRPAVAVLGHGTAVDLTREDLYDSAIRVNGDVQVGLGQKLFTAVADHRHKAVALCYAIFEHGIKGVQQRQTWNDHSHSSSVTVLRIQHKLRSREEAKDL